MKLDEATKAFVKEVLKEVEESMIWYYGELKPILIISIDEPRPLRQMFTKKGIMPPWFQNLEQIATSEFHTLRNVVTYAKDKVADNLIKFVAYGRCVFVIVLLKAYDFREINKRDGKKTYVISPQRFASVLEEILNEEAVHKRFPLSRWVVLDVRPIYAKEKFGNFYDKDLLEVLREDENAENTAFLLVFMLGCPYDLYINDLNALKKMTWTGRKSYDW